MLEDVNAALVKGGRDALFLVMTAKENAEKIGRLLDDLRCNLKDMAQDEIFGSVVAKDAWLMLLLSAKDGLEIASVEGRDHRVTQIGKQIAQVESELSSSLQKVKREGL